jgi:non-ribosomal peptide synthetase component F
VNNAPTQTTPPRVGLYAAPGAEYLAGTLAIWQAGGIVVPLATSHPQRELEYVLQDAGISAVGAHAADPLIMQPLSPSLHAATHAGADWGGERLQAYRGLSPEQGGPARYGLGFRLSQQL